MINFVRIAALAAIILAIPSFLYASEHYAVQAGSLSDKARAQKLLSRLFAIGYDCTSEAQGEQYKVICGNFKSIDEVNLFRQKLRSKGYADAFSVRVTSNGDSRRVSDREDPGNATASTLNRNGNADASLNRALVEYYSVQVGSLSDEARAHKLVSRLSGRSLQCTSVPVGFKFSVICGHLATASDARALRQKIRSMGYADAFAVHVQNGGSIKDISEGVDPDDRLTGALADVEMMEDAQEYYSVQVGSLGDRERAEKLVSRISSSDIKCVPIGVEGRFKVLCGSYDSIDNATNLKMRLISKGFADAFTVRVKGIGGPRDDIVNLNVNLNRLKDRLPSAFTPFEPQIKTAAVTPGIWGRDGGHFHPFAAVSTIYTDNFYSSNENRRAPEKDNVTVASLGFWLSFPSVKKPITDISTIGHVPGGFRGVDIYPFRERNRLAFLSYKAESRSFAEHGYEDGISHYARGHLGYETSRGHSIALDDSYESSRSFVGNAITGTGFVNSPGDYSTNRLAIRGNLYLSDWISLIVEHVSFNLAYVDPAKSIWDRDDTVDSLKLRLSAFSKTQFTFGYSIKDINYAQTFSTDREESEYSLGFSWNMTKKTQGDLKFGKSNTRFMDPLSDSDSNLTVYAGALHYKASSKTDFHLTFSKSRSESDNIGSQYFIHENLSLSTQVFLSSKVKTVAGINRSVNRYYSLVSGGTDKLDREDIRLFGYIMFAYVLNRNIAFELGATHADRSSSMDIYDFNTNGLYTGVAVSF